MAWGAFAGPFALYKTVWQEINEHWLPAAQCRSGHRNLGR